MKPVRQWIKCIRCQRGISTLESLVAVSILSVIIFSFLSWATNHESEVSNLLQGSEIASTMAKVTAAFGDSEEHCANILGGKAFNPGSANGIDIDSIDYYDKNKVLIENVTKQGQVVSEARGIVNSEIKLKPTYQIDAQNTLAHLELKFTKTKRSVGASEIIRKIPVYLTLTAGNITSCSTLHIPQLVLNNRYCEIENGGYSHYDPVLKTCVDDPNVKWFPSPDPLTASCPTGFKVGSFQKKNGSNTLACKSTGGGSAVLSREYRDGAIADNNMVVFAATLSPDSSRCDFTFPVGGQAGFTSSIKCIPKREVYYEKPL